MKELFFGDFVFNCTCCKSIIYRGFVIPLYIFRFILIYL